MGILVGDAVPASGFHMSLFTSTLNVGAMVEPLTSQMADYLGVQAGLMVKQVARKSEAETAGLKAFDVILKVGGDAITTVADWDRSLLANQGKPVQVTVLRDRKQQTLTLQVDSKHRGMIDFDGVLLDDDCPLVVAEIDEDLAQKSAAEALRAQAEKLRESLKSEYLKLDQKQMDALKQQMEEFRQNFKAEDFKLDQKQMDQLKQQMEEFRKNFKAEEFKLDQKQLDELKQKMEELRKTLPEKLNQEMDQLKMLDAPEVEGRA
jgi:C-terminal processing protease CtpA/Prc